VRDLIERVISSSLMRLQEELGAQPIEQARWVVETPKRREHGDYATNVALVLAGRLKRPPMEIAREIVRVCEDRSGFIERVEIKEPGFVNFFLNRNRVLDTIWNSIEKGEGYGRCDLGCGSEVQVEFVSANPTGPLHVGHGRGAALGDVLANILEAVGYRVQREYYINDVGRQMTLLGRSLFQRYLQVMGRPHSWSDELYQGEYLLELARQLAEEDGEKWLELDVDEAIRRLGEHAGSRILDWIKRDLADFGVKFDRWFRESELYEEGDVHEILEELREKGFVYEKDGALWFKSTEFGDEKDRVVVRSNGATTYFASDIAYHANKFRRGFERVINVWGADHHGYIKRMKAAVQALGIDPQRLEILLVQMVNLLRDGTPVAMTTRGGVFATLREVIDEVGKDAARFLFLTRNPESPLDLDLELAKRQEKDNPVYYVQYAHARICSILREARHRGMELPEPKEARLELLGLEQEWELVKSLAFYPEVVRLCATRLEPHRLVNYLTELAAQFHAYYNLGWTDSSARVIGVEESLSRARLSLVMGLRQVFKNALDLLGVEAPEQM
jgi:arginyl-tRNA synthetase